MSHVTVRVMWKPLKGQDRELKVVYPQSEIKWNRFDTKICIGDYNQELCSKTVEIIKVGYLGSGYKLDDKDIIILAGVPLLAVILTIILICVSLKKRFQARNEIFGAYIFHES